MSTGQPDETQGKGLEGFPVASESTAQELEDARVAGMYDRSCKGQDISILKKVLRDAEQDISILGDPERQKMVLKYLDAALSYLENGVFSDMTTEQEAFDLAPLLEVLARANDQFHFMTSDESLKIAYRLGGLLGKFSKEKNAH